jgi:hypothetical protein
VGNTTEKLRKLQKREVECLRDHFAQRVNPSGKEQELDFLEALEINTRVDLPLGELANPEMRNLVMVWKMTHTFVYGPMTSQHQLSAQGLEGLVSIHDVPLYMALLAAIKTGLYRIDIFVPRDWTGHLLRDIANIEEDTPTNQEDAEKELRS